MNIIVLDERLALLLLFRSISANAEDAKKKKEWKQLQLPNVSDPSRQIHIPFS